MSQLQLRPQRQLPRESALSGKFVFFLFNLLESNFVSYELHCIFCISHLHSVATFIGIAEDFWPCPLSPNPLVFCVTDPQGRLRMEECGVLLQIIQEETLPTPRLLWTVTLTQHTFRNHVGRCKRDGLIWFSKTA